MHGLESFTQARLSWPPATPSSPGICLSGAGRQRQKSVVTPWESLLPS